MPPNCTSSTLDFRPHLCRIVDGMRYLLLVLAFGTGCAPSLLEPTASSQSDVTAVATSGTLATEAFRVGKPPRITILPPPAVAAPPAAPPTAPPQAPPPTTPLPPEASCPAGTVPTMDANGQPVCAPPPPDDGMSCPAGSHLALGEDGAYCAPD